MPIREYAVIDPSQGCDDCRKGFERVEAVDAAPLESCPRCGAKVQRQLSTPSIGRSESGLHDRAKSAGFTTYKKTGKGEYEKKY